MKNPFATPPVTEKDILKFTTKKVFTAGDLFIIAETLVWSLAPKTSGLTVIEELASSIDALVEMREGGEYDQVFASLGESLKDLEDEIVEKTIAQQEAKGKVYDILKKKGLFIPSDLKAEVETSGVR